MTTDARLDLDEGDAAGGDETPELPEDLVEAPAGERRVGWRRVVGWVITGLAGALVLLALLAPDDINQLSIRAFLRIPVEGIAGVALFLVLPPRTRRVVAALAGVGLGLMIIVKIIDMGFRLKLSRPFDLVLDWSFLGPAVDFIKVTDGNGAAIGAVVGAIALVVVLLVLMTMSTIRLSRLVAERRGATARVVGAVAVVWVVLALVGVQIAPRLPIASRSAAAYTYYHARQLPDGVRDARQFAAESSVDAFRNTPGSQLLTGLRGKDVALVFVESYGRSAIQDPLYAPRVDAVLDAGSDKLRAAGFASKTGWLTSSTVGGGSWLAHSTLLSGLWINNQQRYRNLVSGDRLTLNRAFQRASWRTVDLEPALMHPYPEGSFFGYDKIYAAKDLGYHGPWFGYSTMPDQYTMSALHRTELAPGHQPVMAEITLLSSHAPWTSIPHLIDWDSVGDGSAFNGMQANVDPAQERVNYRSSIEYTLNSLISYVQTYGDDNLVMVFLGDHEPASSITADMSADRDVPITIVAKDPAVLSRISGWGWTDGLRPAPQAPVWRMDAFRDRFLTAFGSQQAAQAH